MPIRCAVAGLNRGRLFVERLNANPHCRVVAVCDPRPQKLAEHSGIDGFADFQEMLDKARPDMVAIVTPGPAHGPQSVAALQAGAHVLVETPNVYSAPEAQSVVTAARAKGLKYMLAENYPYMGCYQALAEVVQSGKLGTLLGAMGEYTHDCRPWALVDAEGRAAPLSRIGEPGLTPQWRVSELPPLAYCSHTLGPLLALLEDRCVTASGVCGGKQTLGGVEVVALETAVLQTQAGRTINLTNGFMLGHPFVLYLAIYGTTGSVRFMSDTSSRMIVACDAEGGKWQERPASWVERPDGKDHLQVLIDEFIESVRTDTSPPFDEARSMDFCLPGVIAHESAMGGGRQLDIPLF